jgi:hypothetical protein
MNRFKLATALLVAMLSNMASAMPITGVTVRTDFPSPGYQNSVIENVVNGNGLTSYTTGATHAAALASNSWVAITPAMGHIIFDLGEVYDLDGMAVWNFNGEPKIGIKDLTISGSLDGASFAPITGAPNSFAIGVFAAPQLAEVFSLATTAQFIRFDVASNYGFILGGEEAIGLSEVIFTGDRAAVIPTPATLALFGLGLAGLVWSRRKKA